MIIGTPAHTCVSSHKKQNAGAIDDAVCRPHSDSLPSLPEVTNDNTEALPISVPCACVQVAVAKEFCG